MEFFGLADIRTNEARLQQCLRLERLPEFCSGISSLVEHTSELEGEVYCMWGHFALRKENINGGVRFTMPTCPNSLAWTVTTGFPPHPEGGGALHHQPHRARPGIHCFHRGVCGHVGSWAGGLA